MAEPLSEQDQWPKGWDGHESAQLRRLARLTFAQKLEWLEEAGRMVRHMRSQQRRNDTASPPSQSGYMP